MRIYNFTDEVGVFNTNIDTQLIVKDLYELRDKDTKSDGASNVNGWQKEINHITTDYSWGKELKSEILQNFFQYIQSCNIFKKPKSENKPLNLSLSMVKMFVNINPPDASHTMHDHVGGHYSGAFWLQADVNSGRLIIMNPMRNTFINSFCQNTIQEIQDGYQTFNNINIFPESNKGVFFNNNLLHYVDINRSEKDRIGVAFHIMIKEG